MNNLVSTVEKDIQRLRATISSENEEQIDREVPALERNLLHGEGYSQIWDERLLAEALHLLTHVSGPARQEHLAGLRRHLQEVRAIHTKLYTVLDPAINLDDLLNLHLNTWPRIPGPIDCSFDPQIKDRLHAARQLTMSEQQIEAFFEFYLGHLTSAGRSDVAQILAPVLAAAREAYIRIHSWTVQALFSTGMWGEVHGLKIQARPQGIGRIRCTNTIDPDMERAASNAVACLYNRWVQSRQWGSDLIRTINNAKLESRPFNGCTKTGEGHQDPAPHARVFAETGNNTSAVGQGRQAKNPCA